MIRSTFICKELCKPMLFRAKLQYLGFIHLPQRFYSSEHPSSTHGKLISLASISKSDLGESIFKNKETTGVETTHDNYKKSMTQMKMIMLGTTFFFLPMSFAISYDMVQSYNNPLMTALLGLVDGILVLMFIRGIQSQRQMPLDIYFNKETQTFTSVHYNFFQFMALRFHPDEGKNIHQEITLRGKKHSVDLLDVHGRIISLSCKQEWIRDHEAFKLLTKNKQSFKVNVEEEEVEKKEEKEEKEDMEEQTKEKSKTKRRSRGKFT